MFEHPVEIHDTKTLIKFSHDAVIKIAQLDCLKVLKIVHGNLILIYIMKLLFIKLI